MKVDIQLFASLGRYAPSGKGDASHAVTLEQGATVGALLDRLGVPAGVVKLVFVNGVHATGETVLHDGDRVGVFPPVAGG
ncbi:MAG: MoaD/ThiS family protein [Deltaproteobacteria bacterium]|nr:MoaD/ThiS family protein [Deltaproteobacteria bacterium]